MRILKYAIKNIKRNAFLSFSSVLVISLIIFFINILLLVNFTTDELIGDINSRLSMSITFNKGYSSENSEVVELISGVKSISDNINVIYVSSDEALSEMKKYSPDLTQLVETDSENPLPASIKVENIGIGEYDELNDVISKYKGVVIYDEAGFKNNIIAYKAQHERVKGVIQVFNSIKIGIYVIICSFIFSVFIIIYNTIGNFIFFYRDEIKVTKLVGGDNVFIYGPFSVQGLIYTIFSTVLSLLIFIYIIKTVNIYLIKNFPEFIDKFLLNYKSYFFYEIGGMSFVGIISGFLSSQKFINKAGSTKLK
ncbi:MAG: permease-like cell division protein FtsX [Candidatus Gracilibacteria bacterium]|nr:permease-like cell division protein FtsX [Candidatus Gracilibacteria bacterium]MDD2909060.1 permease-like cell division protein FtsX [Candidatus Gracilibacteria bacterium]